jgi:hypothetical protein
MNQTFSQTAMRIKRIAFTTVVAVGLVVGSTGAHAELPLQLMANSDRQAPTDTNEPGNQSIQSFALPRILLDMTKHDTLVLQKILAQTEQETGKTNGINGEFMLTIFTAIDGSVESINYQCTEDSGDLFETINGVCKRLKQHQFSPIEMNGTAVSGMVQVRVKMLK